MYKEDLALNNLQWLICHKTQPNQTISNVSKLISSSSSSSSRHTDGKDFLNSLAIGPYQPSILITPRDGIQCPRSADKCEFLSVI